MSLPLPRHLRVGTVAAGLAALALVLTACGGAGDAGVTAASEGTVRVVASTNVYGSIVRAVGGDQVTVTSIINNPSADPHSHEATPAEAASVAQAQLVVLNGGGYDDFMAKLVESAGGDRPVINAVEESGLEPATADGHDHADAHDHGEFNEHVWYSLPAVGKVASRIATELGTVDSAHAAEFTANADTFNAQVAGLLDRTKAIGTAHPGVRVAVTEPLPGWLLHDAGLTDVTPEEFAHAVETDTDPPAAVVQQTLALFTTDPVRALLLNAQTQTPTTDQVRQAATTANVPVVEMTETLPEGVTDYVGWMGGQIDALTHAVDRS
ncbi:metal ABC transporter solute-binding protein, Zn/Mn family [Pseudonocardia asaccharolytica]|uniref:Metal ABC transporter substrate-binding protein n=1 Tax=Pseudonocardia asaccharolytica DSM 44247 = NBRC 16224 TaxID=1123024 RepID=A0A511D3D9_9PSEU|nr:zinc ABC transporter substrate-binding protein [Pseudonocardia asaccharolytica]GEL17428.1 metal ABC transporter substrate-binding protein [Pseudonocardia asaccharolytica DSM 44247 = NBRC 16224]